MTRAVIYARYSTDMQREASIEDQVRVCTALATRMGATVAEVFTDYGVSGSTQLRPGFQNLLAAISSGSADLIIAEALDRISRDQEHIAAFFKQVRFGNVTLVTVSEGEISELHVGLKGTMNALFLKDLGLKTHRGIEGRVRQGRSGGGKAYGYNVVRELDARGDPIRGGRVINPDEAAIVTRIFSDFAVGHSPRAIARALNAEGISGPNGEAWQDTTIRGHAERGTGILRNALYAGQLIWNRQRYIKDPTTGNRVSRLNPRSAWITHDVPDLRIIDPDLWDRVQARLAGIRQSERAIKVRETQFWKHRRPRYLLTGKAFCGNCGGSLSAIGKDYLACATARNKGTCTNKRGIRREIVEDQILDALRTQLMQPDLVREFSTAFIAEINHQRARLERERRLRDRTDGRDCPDAGACVRAGHAKNRPQWDGRSWFV